MAVRRGRTAKGEQTRRTLLEAASRLFAANGYLDSRLPRLRSQNLADRIRAEIFWYLSDHVEHLELAKVWHDAANFDPEIAETRRRERARRQARVRKGIEAAPIRPDIDPEIAAAALTAMLEEFAHRWFVEAEGPGRSAQDVVAASETLAALWLAALGLQPDTAIR